MELVFIAALAAAGVGLALPLKDREVRERWRKLADRLGLAFSPGRLLESDGMEGQVSGHLVRIDNQRRQGTRVSVGLEDSECVKVLPRHLWFFESGARHGDRLEFGDARMATLVRHIGLSRLFLLLMEASNEAILDEWIYSAHISIERREVSLMCPERIDNPEVLGIILGGLARLTEGLEDARRMAERLGENARSVAAPIPRRLACLSLLLEHFPESPEGGRSSWSIVKGPTVCTPEGLQLRLLAMRHLHPVNPRSELAAAIDDGLNQSAPLLRQIAVEAVLSLDHDEAAPRVLKALLDPDRQVAMTALRMCPLLVWSEPKDLEDQLIHLLYKGPTYLRVDIICALASVGSPRAIAPLTDLEKVSDPGVRRMCKHTLERLRTRFPERQNGSLSLVSEGDLSLTSPPTDV